MRCPKCGYNSFDHLDSCKKCGKDLLEFKQKFGIKSVLFPGQMSSSGVTEEDEFDSVAADNAVSVATGAAVAATATAVSAADDGATAAGTDGDDFGFDFMGDSAEDDDLSFDELFEEAPEDEDIEETIEGPKGPAEAEIEAEIEAEAEANTGSDDDISFDLLGGEADLEDDFGFDPVDEAGVSTTEDDFSLGDEGLDLTSESEDLTGESEDLTGESEDLTGESEDSGSEEDPQRPFDLPESSHVVGAPEDSLNNLKGQSSFFVADRESVDSFLEEGEASIVYELSEGDISEPDEPPLFPPEPTDQSDSVVAASEAIVATTVPLAVADASIETPVVRDDLPAAGTIPPPSLLSCVKAFFCDLILLIVVGISFVVAAEAAMATGKSRLLPSLETLINLSIPYFLVLFFLSFGYFTLFHFLVGQTPGKMLTGLRVETTEGEPLLFSQAFLRSVGGLLQLLSAGLGYLMILSNPERRGWNDRLAGTRVVNLQDLS